MGTVITKKYGKPKVQFRSRKLWGTATVTITCQSEEEAKQVNANLQREIDKGIIPDVIKQRLQGQVIIIGTVKDLIRSYQRHNRQLKEYDIAVLNTLYNEIGHVNLHEINFKWIQDWINALKDRRKTPGTINNKIGSIRRCFDWAVIHETTPVTMNYFRLLPRGFAFGETENKERDRRLEAGEEDAIRRIMAGGKHPERQRPAILEYPEAMQLMMELALETAMRMREMFTLTWDQVNFDHNAVFLTKTKNGSKRQVPLTTIAKKALMEYKLKHRAKHHYTDPNTKKTYPIILPFWDGRKVSLNSTTNSLSRKWSRIFDHAGLIDFKFHDFRHEATSRFFERTTLQSFEIRKITGHKTERMLDRYANLRASDLAVKLW